MKSDYAATLAKLREIDMNARTDDEAAEGWWMYSDTILSALDIAAKVGPVLRVKLGFYRHVRHAVNGEEIYKAFILFARELGIDLEQGEGGDG